MGTQQLLLLVLSAFIVSLAAFVGIQAFQQRQAQLRAEALVQDVVRVASEAQHWYAKPSAFGGGGSASWNAFGFDRLGYDALPDSSYATPNGNIAADPNVAQLTLIAIQDDANTRVTAVISGTAANDIDLTIEQL